MGSESLSSAFGWVSIACWLVVFSPQIIENYQLQSGEGLSVAFVLAWLAGDLCNFFGAVMARLQPTVIILAIYYALCDIILLGQIYYYHWKRSFRNRRVSIGPPQVILQTENGEQAPLLGTRPSQPHQQPNSHSDNISAPKITGEPEEEREGVGRAALRYALAVLFVIGVGLAAWFISGRHGKDDNSGPGGGEDGGRESDEKDIIEWKSQVIGWTSAVLYLGSRIPQILKNFKTRCEGLSLALFLFSIMGNVTYVLSICTDSMEPRHLIANASWLAGSGLTVFLDIFVLCQFFYFRRVDARYIRVAEAE